MTAPTDEANYCQNCYSNDFLYDMETLTFDFNNQKVNFLDCFTFCTGFKIEKETGPKICQMCVHQLKTAYSMKNQCFNTQPYPMLYTTTSIIADPLPLLSTPVKKEKCNDRSPDIDVPDVVKTEVTTVNAASKRPSTRHRSKKSPRKSRELNFTKYLRKGKKNKYRYAQTQAYSDAIKSETPDLGTSNAPPTQEDFEWEFPDEKKLYEQQSDEELVQKHPYKCHNCRARFATKILCRNHINRNHNENFLLYMYKCKSCSKVFKSHGGFRSHFSSHHAGGGTNRRSTEKPRNFLCVHCGRSFLFPSDLEIHQKTHSEERSFRCHVENCVCAFKTKYALERHVGVVHLERDGEFTCKSCNMQFTKQEILDTHMVSHSSKTCCACLRCGKNFTCLIEMQKHLLVEEHKADADRYRPTSNGATEKIFKCSQCETVYGIFFSLRQHIIAEHYSEKNTFQCEVCSKIYRTKFMLEQHAFTHKKVLPFQCAEENCIYKSNNKQNFKGHLKRLHDMEYDEKLHGYNATRSLEISKKHEEILKSGYVRPYLSKKASQKKIITTNPWKCKQCPRTFSHSGNLARHINVEHKHLLYECKFCDRKFSGQAGLWIHSFSHRGNLKPFNCPSCEYRTTHKLNFKGHLQKRHEITYDEQIHGYKETMKEVMNFIMKKKDLKDDTMVPNNGIECLAEN